MAKRCVLTDMGGYLILRITLEVNSSFDIHVMETVFSARKCMYIIRISREENGLH